MPHHNDFCYDFGPYRLNSQERVLTCAGEVISLPPKATDVLLLLVSNAGQLVEKDELLKQVWPNTFVEEANLTQNIFLLRRVLGHERAGPRYIETVTRRGYRFVADVTVVEAEMHAEAEALASAAAALTSRTIVAVLPFLNDTSDEALEYLADGLTDNLINNLSRVSRLRVLSRSAVFRHRRKEVDPQVIGKELGASAVLLGKLNSRPAGIVISVELVEAATGWLLWGESFDCQSKDILEIQDAITRQLLASLKLQLSGEEEKHVTARYTENAEAYQSYLEGRYHWSRYTRKGIEKAIGHFRRAIELDPNYALAYAGIVDCYLRLATNYLPPENDVPRADLEAASEAQSSESDPRVKLRFEWDWKGAERELRRANELKTDYPSAHQWYAAYRTSKQLYKESLSGSYSNRLTKVDSDSRIASQIPSIQLTPAEEVQILCSVARDQIAIGNFEAANLILRRWSVLGKWPKLDLFNPYTAADLLFTLGILFGCIASSRKINYGHKHAEAFLNGSIALFEQLGIKSRSVEGRVELARCYYRQGFFDIARETISDAYSQLPDDQTDLKTLCLTVWGAIERDSGRLKDSLAKLREAMGLEVGKRLAVGLYYHDLATTLKDLATSEPEETFFDEATLQFRRALYECDAIGHHRFAAAVENNFGFLLLSRRSFEESEKHLLRSQRLFECFSDSVRGAQVKETLARLYIETEQYSRAQQIIGQAVETLEITGGEAFLSEALTTAGVVAVRQGRYSDAEKNFEAAYRVAERCGDNEGAGRALLIMIEEIGNRLAQPEKILISEKLKRLFAASQQTALLVRVNNCISELTG
jgi:DNA-binding winged helix-turn-helix (wHTH) protein